jgi:hypothetical protein
MDDGRRRLSPREREALLHIENALRSDDPRFAELLSLSRRRSRTARLLASTSVTVYLSVGAVLLVAALALGDPVIVMVSAACFLCARLRHSGALCEPGSDVPGVAGDLTTEH